MAWFVYLIECADGSIYTGIAKDVAARFVQHCNGTGARYTRSRKPVAVLASFELTDRASALRAEYRVKQLSPARKRALAGGAFALEALLPLADEPSSIADRRTSSGKPPSSSS